MPKSRSSSYIPFPVSRSGLQAKWIKDPSTCKAETTPEMSSALPVPSRAAPATSKKRPYDHSANPIPDTEFEGNPRVRQRTESLSSVETIRAQPVSQSKSGQVRASFQKLKDRLNFQATAKTRKSDASVDAPSSGCDHQNCDLQVANRPRGPEADLDAHKNDIIPNNLTTPESSAKMPKPKLLEYRAPSTGLRGHSTSVTKATGVPLQIRDKNISHPLPRSAIPVRSSKPATTVTKPAPAVTYTSSVKAPRHTVTAKQRSLHVARVDSVADNDGIVPMCPRASDLQLEFAFNRGPHFEMWDIQEDITFAWPLQIQLNCKDLDRWETIPLITPEIEGITITCATKWHADHEKQFPYLKGDSESAYFVSYQGATTQDPHMSGLVILPEKGIYAASEWERTYTRRAVEKGKPNQMPGKRGWALKVWVPIPTRLFEKRETRAFTLTAKVWIANSKSKGKSRVEEPIGRDTVGVEPLSAETEITVSHLRKEREMV